MKLPVFLKRDAAPVCDEPVYFVVAAEGVFQVRDLPTHRSVTRYEGRLPGLRAQHEGLLLRFPRLPAVLLADALAFFADIDRLHEAEAIVLVFYRAETHEFRIEPPPQRIPGYVDWRGRWRSSLSLDYDSLPRPEGFVRLGTIHSHSYMPAIPSSTDCMDERWEDGLHVIYGSFGREKLSRCASFIAGGVRFDLDPDDVLEPCEVPAVGAPRGWLDRVSCGKASGWRSTNGHGGKDEHDIQS